MGEYRSLTDQTALDWKDPVCETPTFYVCNQFTGKEFDDFIAESEIGQIALLAVGAKNPLDSMLALNGGQLDDFSSIPCGVTEVT
jgi:hypothetical protein